MDPITPEIWRRMIRAAFEKKLGLEGVHQAIAFWNLHFAQETDIQKHIRPFAQAYAEFMGQSSSKSELALLLISSLHTRLEMLPPDPQPQQLNMSQVATSPASSLTNTKTSTSIDATLGALILALHEALQLDSQGSVWATQFWETLQAPSTVQNLKLDDAQQNAWGVWLRQPENLNLHANLSVKQATKLVNLLYVSLTEAMGPVEADRLLSRSVQQVEATPTGRSLSPRSFL